MLDSSSDGVRVGQTASQPASCGRHGAEAIAWDAGASHVADVWAIERGIAITAFYPEDDDPDLDALGELVTTLQTEDTEQVRTVVVTAGVFAIMLEYQPGAGITEELLAQAHAGATPELAHGLLVQCPNGIYEVHRDELEHDCDGKASACSRS